MAAKSSEMRSSVIEMLARGLLFSLIGVLETAKMDHGKYDNASAVKAVSVELDNVLVLQNQCHGLLSERHIWHCVSGQSPTVTWV